MDRIRGYLNSVTVAVDDFALRRTLSECNLIAIKKVSPNCDAAYRYVIITGLTMAAPLRKFASAIGEFGILAGVLYVIDQALERSASRLRLRFYEIMVQPVPDEPLAPGNLTKSFETRELGPDSPDVARFPRPDEVISQRFDQDAVCLGGYKKGELIGFLWVKFGEYNEDEVRCVFAPQPASKTVFDFDIYLFQEHRFGIGFIGLWDGANAYLRRNGVDFTCSRVSRFNTGSRQSHEHLGWKRVGKALFLCGSSSQLMIASLKPYFHFSRNKNNIPKIAIDTNKFSASR